MQIHMQHVIYPSEAEPVALLAPCTLLCRRPGHQMILIREEIMPSSAFRAFVCELQLHSLLDGGNLLAVELAQIQ